MQDGGHVWPSLSGTAEGYQDARWQASALKVRPFHPGAAASLVLVPINVFGLDADVLQSGTEELLIA
jgi:hypothetical protein